jgi:hypothetical protein
VSVDQTGKSGSVTSSTRLAVAFVGVSVYAAIVTGLVLSLTVQGPFDPKITGSMGEWMSGIMSGGAVLIAVYTVNMARTHQRHDRQVTTMVAILLQGFEAAIQALAEPTDQAQRLVRHSMNLCSVVSDVNLQAFIAENPDLGPQELHSYLDALAQAITSMLEVTGFTPSFAPPRRPFRPFEILR